MARAARNESLQLEQVRGREQPELDEAGLRFIVDSRMTKAPTDLASNFRWHGDPFTDRQLIDTITPRTGHRNENNPDLRAEPVWDPVAHPGSWRAVWAYSRKGAVRDATTLTAQKNRAREVMEGQKAARTPRFVKTTGENAASTRRHWHAQGSWQASRAT